MARETDSLDTVERIFKIIVFQGFSFASLGHPDGVSGLSTALVVLRSPVVREKNRGTSVLRIRSAPVGLILCAGKGAAEARYALDNLSNKCSLRNIKRCCRTKS